MAVYLYPGGFRLIRKSGVGQAIVHQQKALRAAGIPLAQTLEAADEKQREKSRAGSIR